MGKCTQRGFYHPPDCPVHFQSNSVADVHHAVAEALENLRPRFNEKCELTFIMRLPGHDDADMVITNDDFGELAKVIERMKARAADDTDRQSGATEGSEGGS